jgi:predicted DNA-binding transcriptional regulator AlpA
MDDALMSIPEFCERNTISRSLFYKIQAEGRGPRLMRIAANRVAISPQAEAEWRRAREVDAEAEKEAV